MPDSTSHAPLRPGRLPLRYRIGWRLSDLALSAYGPAEPGGEGQPDPHRRMRQERAARAGAATLAVERGCQRRWAAPG